MNDFVILGLGLPPAILGMRDFARWVIVVWNDRRELKLLEKNPISPGEQRFYVKSTHAKYMMGEDSSEFTKVREIRALREVDQIRIDRAPTYLVKSDTAAENLIPIKQECFAMPGVALRRDEYYQVSLGEDQIFKARADHKYLISVKLRARLDLLHDNDKEDFIQIEKPLGTEKFVVEVHFPPTRKLKKVNKEVQLEVYEVRGSDVKKVDRKKFKVNAQDAVQTTPEKFTDMFRLTLLHPSQDADIRIMWKWSVVS